jgi:soluble lytic murein transglycosylase
MQLMPATARRTAERNGMAFDVNRLTADPAYNARIGAAHLGELFGEYGGNYILSFAAYNAGGRRVKEWTTAYGDPRDPAVDKVDWIERIPISETRHYVQKVMENLQVYRARLSGARIAAITPDLERGARSIKATLNLRLAELPAIGAPNIR